MSEASESPFQSELLINKNKELLCKQALQCLQQVLDSVGFLLKPQLLRVSIVLHKESIQPNIVKAERGPFDQDLDI